MTKTKTKTKPKATKTTKTSAARGAASAGPAYRLRRSRVHGSGLFATREIPNGAQIIEYVGERISHAEADRRHADKAEDDGHTFLFTIDAKTVIDAGVGGNEARFINHSCDPNCEVILTDGRPLVEALRTLRAGEELSYDYNLTREPEDPPEIEVVFACRCGAPICRGSMLAPPRKPKPEPKPKPKVSRATANARVKRAAGRKRAAAHSSA